MDGIGGKDGKGRRGWRALLPALALLVAPLPLLAADDARDVTFFVVVKSSNYAQDVEGRLKLLNYHFFAEIFPRAGAPAPQATLNAAGFTAPKKFEPHGKSFYVEGGHFQSQEALDRVYPNGAYTFDLGKLGSKTLLLAGPRGRTDIPHKIEIGLEQNGRTIRPDRIDPAQPLRIRWTEFSNGRADPKRIVDDMIFVVVQDCLGQRIVHTGLPFEGNYLRFDRTDLTIPGGTLKAGEPHAMFVEMPHVADSAMLGATPGFASYATATYLDLHTTGAASRACPKKPPPMDTGQTDRGG